MIVGEGWARVVLGGQWPCTDFDFMRFDPEGLWARLIYQFPGTGRSHPLGPGQTVVLATDAINHADYIEGGLDLSGADFEFLGTNDIDNPAVPNLINIGPGLVTRSYIYRTFVGVPFVARRLDLDTLPRRWIEVNEELEYLRLPRNALLDLGHMIWFGGLPVCDAVVDPSLDAAAAALHWENESPLSMQRRVLVTNPEGPAILQDTNTSARDFTVLPRSPGEIW